MALRSFLAVSSSDCPIRRHRDFPRVLKTWKIPFPPLEKFLSMSYWGVGRARIFVQWTFLIFLRKTARFLRALSHDLFIEWLAFCLKNGNFWREQKLSTVCSYSEWLKSSKFDSVLFSLESELVVEYEKSLFDLENEFFDEPFK